MFKPALLAACLCATAAVAQTPVHVAYAGYAHGFNVVNLDATLSFTPGRYKMELEYTLVGVLGAVLHGDGKTTVTGRFEGLRAEPDDLFSTGHFRGEPRVTQIAWRGGTPSLLQLQPPVESERDPVPVAQQANTIDTLSAMAGLIHQVAETGKCDQHGRTFDGRRLSEVSARTAGQEALEHTGRSMFEGSALRCDFQGKQLAGFKRDADQDELRKPQEGSAWFAAVKAGEPPVPVRITFTTPAFGDMTLYLTGVR